MKSIKIYLSILFGIFFLASCEKEIEFKGEITEPLIVVNCFITPDSVMTAHVSESRFFLVDNVTFRNVKNADVSVWVNGVFKEKMSFVENGIYKGTYAPVIGDSIKLVVKVPTMKDVSCEELISPQPEIISIDTTDLWTGQTYNIQYGSQTTNGGQTTYTNDTIATVTGHQIDYTLKFKDNGNEKNFYRLVVMTKEHYFTIDTTTSDTTTVIRDNYYFSFTDVVSGNNANNDPLSMGDFSANNEYNVFSDELFNGKTYSLTFTTNEDVYNYKADYPYGREMPGKKVVNIYLQNISKSYYLYLKSRPAALNGNGFFSEPVQIHNNITGGIGILGSYTPSNVKTIELK